jgi:hypothetical protein
VPNHAFRSLLLAALLASLSGCQVIWASITSPSDWASGISTSLSGSIDGSLVSSGSKSPGDSSSAYREDVRVLAATRAAEGALDVAFLREVSGVALRHGISDWQAEPATFDAIGEGLREAGLDETEIETTLAALAR